MKKVLVVLLALLALGVFAFADDEAPALTMGATVKTGFEIDGGSADGVKTTGNIYESDDPTFTRADVSGTISGTTGGAAFTFREDNVSATGATVTVPTAYGWWKPVSIVNLKAGVGHGIAYESPIEGWDNGDTGFQAVISPIDGLTIAGDYYFSATPTELDGNYLGGQVSYAAKDLVTIGVNALNNVYIFGVDIKAVKDLTAMIDGKYDNSGSDPVTSLEEKIGYAVGGASPYIMGYQTLYKDYTDIIVKVGASYALGSYTPGAYFKYYLNGADDAENFFKVGAFLDVAADKNSVEIYGDYKSGSALDSATAEASDSTWDFGIRYIVSL
jgi:hypothetical protein